MPPLNDRIRLAREALHLTREAMAAQSGIPRESLATYELAKSKPGADALERLCRAGISPAWLLLGEEPMLRSGPPRSELQRLQLAIEAAEEGLAGVGRTLAPAQKAELIMAVLELFSTYGEGAKDKVAQLVRLAA